MKTLTRKHLAAPLLAIALACSTAPGRAQAPAPSATPTAVPAGGACPPVAAAPTAQDIQAAQSAARDRGFLWRISKGGRASYLYGTLHVGKLAWAPPGPTLQKALAESQVLALELDISDPATLMKLQTALASQPEDPPLDAALAQRLANEAAGACLPNGLLDGQKPAVKALTLLIMAARWDDLDATYAQEAVLAGHAQSRRLPIVALETVDEQMAAWLPTTAEEQRQAVQQALDQLKSGAARRGARRLAQAWADGRLDELSSYEQWCECVTTEQDRQQLRRLNDDRNPAIASRIDRLHSQGRTLFAGVGALHMVGAKSLPLLLQQRGYTVERVSFAR